MELNNTLKWQNKFETVILDCHIYGVPHPVKSWYFNLTLLKPGQNLEYQFDNRTGSIKISEIDESMAGLYICKGVSEFGSTTFAHRIELAGIKKTFSITEKKCI